MGLGLERIILIRTFGIVKLKNPASYYWHEPSTLANWWVKMHRWRPEAGHNSCGRKAAAAPTAMPRDDAAPSTPAPASKRLRGPDVREHRLGDDGLFTHNRRGVELCRVFQTGECLEKDRRGFCAKNSSRRHQRAKCLNEFHGAGPCPSVAPRAPKPNHGKGRGKKGKR